MTRKTCSSSVSEKPPASKLMKRSLSSENQYTSASPVNQTPPTLRKPSSGSFSIDNLLQVPSLSQTEKSRTYVESLRKSGLMWPPALNATSITQPMGFIISQQQNYLLSVPQPAATEQSIAQQQPKPLRLNSNDAKSLAASSVQEKCADDGNESESNDVLDVV